MKSQPESRTTPELRHRLHSPRHPLTERGFSLIELMVGMAIGLIAVIVILQTLSFFENQKRTTTSGSDAQQSGLMGLFAIEQEVRKAGNGFASNQAYSCQNFFSYFDGDGGGSSPATVVGSFNSSPITLINDANSARPYADSIVVRTGIRFTGSVPTRLIDKMDTAARTLLVERAYDFTNTDLILVVSPDFVNCALMQVTTVDTTTKLLTTAPGQTPEYNPDSTYLTDNNWPGYGTRAAEVFPKDSFVYRIGDVGIGSILSQTFSIQHPANTNTYNLQLVSSSSGAVAATDILANDIINIQAQYGLSASNTSRAVTTWRSPDHSDITTLSAQDLRKRVKAIRMVLIARSSKRETAIVTPRCTAITTTGPCACQNATNNYGPCPWRDTSTDQAPAIDLRASDADTEWQHYRYKTYETVIPLRNSIWPAFL